MRGERRLIPVVAERIGKVHGTGAGHVVALDDVSLEVCTGEVVALLGRNGAGKSSLLRILSGRDGADRGHAAVFGHDLASHLHRAAPLVGALVDRPGFLGGLSVHANLELVARRHGLGGTEVGVLLERCGLDGPSRGRTVAACSLGMRQRLGIAAALLGAPPLLILDEPTNGLDPAGIAWVRELVRAHANDGGAVLLASHLMGEVDAVADQVVVLRDGRVAHRGTPGELARSVAVPVRLRTGAPPAEAARVLAAADIEVLDRRDDELHVRPTSDQLQRLSLLLAEAGIAVVSLEPTVSPLEVLLAAAEAP